MPIRPCPRCNQPTAKLIQAVSDIATVNYYRCERCGHVWTLPKDDPSAPSISVTREEPSRAR